MRINFNTGFFAIVLAISTALSSCSKSNDTEKAELEKIRQELAELKEEIASTPKADDIAFDTAKRDGRVRAYGKYATDFVDGKHIEGADEGAWASAKRQNSVLAFEAYQRYFPEGKYLHESVSSTHKVQTQASEKILGDLGYNISDFPKFGAISIDSDGNVEAAADSSITIPSISIGTEPTRIEKVVPPDNSNERREKLEKQEEREQVFFNWLNSDEFCNEIEEVIFEGVDNAFESYPLVSPDSLSLVTSKRLFEAQECTTRKSLDRSESAYFCKWNLGNQFLKKIDHEKIYEGIVESIHTCFPGEKVDEFVDSKDRSISFSFDNGAWLYVRYFDPTYTALEVKITK